MLTLAMVAGCGRGTRPTEWEVHRRELAVRPFNGHDSPFAFSPDLTRVAQKACRAHGMRSDQAVIDGRESRVYDQVWTIVFSPDSKRVGYGVDLGKEHFAVIDGRPGPVFDEWVPEIVFSPDSKRVAHLSSSLDHGAVVVDGKVTTYPDFVHCKTLQFSPNSKRVAYHVGNSICVDGKLVGPFEQVQMWSLKFLPDSSDVSFAYKRHNREYFRFAGKDYGPFDEVDSISAIISPDSRRIAYPVKKGGRWFLWCDGVEHGPYEIRPDAIFGPDSSFAIVSGAYDGPQTVTIEKLGETTGLTRVSNVAFSQDGSRVAFSGVRNGKAFLSINGRQRDLERPLTDLLFSPDSRRLVGVARNGEKCSLWEDGAVGQLAFGYIICIRFSPDSRHLVYFGEEKGAESVLLIDGHEVLRGDLHREVFITRDNRIRTATIEPLPGASTQPAKDIESIVRRMRLVLFELTPR